MYSFKIKVVRFHQVADLDLNIIPAHSGIPPGPRGMGATVNELHFFVAERHDPEIPLNLAGQASMKHDVAT